MVTLGFWVCGPLSSTQPFLHRASHTNYTSGRSLHWTACFPALCFQHLSKPFNGVSGILFQPIRLKLSLSNWSCKALTNQSSSILTNQNWCLLNQSNSEDLESSFTWGLTNQGPRAGTFVHRSQLPNASESILSLFLAELNHWGWLWTAEQSRANQLRLALEWSRTKHSGAD